ncbi:MAG: hypothetical protein MZW92_63985 [Comamonadaceae bacterium]|nr:hypothetical protein [Comamonadaceae bacterium]
MEHFFATCPRGLEDLPRRRAERASAPPTWRSLPAAWVAAGDWPLLLPRQPRSRHRHARPVAGRQVRAIGDEEDIYRLAYDVRLARVVRCRTHVARRRHRDRSPLRSLDFITLQGEGRGLRPLPRRARQSGRASIPQSPDVRHARVPHVGRSARSTSIPPASRCSSAAASAAAGEAPLKENLAAGILRADRLARPDEPLLDPMCGSGTLADRGGADGARHRPRPAARASASRGSPASIAAAVARPAASAARRALGRSRQARDLRQRPRTASR